MRVALIVFFYFFNFISAEAQNLVPNASFEKVHEITNWWMGTGSQFNRIMKWWQSPTQGSPDILFVKVKDNMKPPRNGFDLSPYEPRSGKMMLGIKTYGCKHNFIHCKEYIQVKLTDSLIVGMEYYVEFYANPMHTSISSNHLGAALSTVHTYQYHEQGLYYLTPKANSTALLRDTGEWQKISATFVADSAYQFLLIGNFFPDEQTKFDTSGAKIKYAYVLLDDVRLVRSDQKMLAFSEQFDLDRIQFELNQSALLPTAFPVLEEIVALLKSKKQLRLMINGHTDDSGSEQHNQQLSEARAKRVYDFMVAQGIEAKRLVYKGFGATQAIAPNETVEGRQQNRRVAFELIE